MKILFLDLEYEPHEAYVWKIWQENIPIQRLKREGGLICWGAKWYDQDHIIQGQDIEELHALIEEADVLVTYYGSKADIPFMNKEFIKIGLPPPAPYKHIDLCKVVKKHFKLPSYKLEYVAKAFGMVNQKLGHDGFQLWVECMDGNKEALQKMYIYNAGDVLMNEELYTILLPWITNHPNVGLYQNKEHACPNCGGHDLQRRGYAYTRLGKYARFQCKECGTWSQGKHNEAVKELVR